MIFLKIARRVFVEEGMVGWGPNLTNEHRRFRP